MQLAADAFADDLVKHFGCAVIARIGTVALAMATLDAFLGGFGGRHALDRFLCFCRSDRRVFGFVLGGSLVGSPTPWIDAGERRMFPPGSRNRGCPGRGAASTRSRCGHGRRLVCALIRFVQSIEQQRQQAQNDSSLKEEATGGEDIPFLLRARGGGETGRRWGWGRFSLGGRRWRSWACCWRSRRTGSR